MQQSGKETDTSTRKSQCSSMVFIDLFRPAGRSRVGSDEDSYYHYHNTHRHTNTHIKTEKCPHRMYIHLYVDFWLCVRWEQQTCARQPYLNANSTQVWPHSWDCWLMAAVTETTVCNTQPQETTELHKITYNRFMTINEMKFQFTFSLTLLSNICLILLDSLWSDIWWQTAKHIISMS